MQKVMYKGLLPEDKTLREIKITNGAKIMVVGSTINDVLAVNTPKEVIQQEVKAEENKKEPLCRQKVRLTARPQNTVKYSWSSVLLNRQCYFQQHRKVLDKGKPDDIMASVKGTKVRGAEESSARAAQGQLCDVTNERAHHPSLPANRSDYQPCLYPECSTSPEGKFDSRSNWSRISCGSGQRVRFHLDSDFFAELTSTQRY